MSSSLHGRIQHALTVIEASVTQFMQDLHDVKAQYEQWQQEHLLQVPEQLIQQQQQQQQQQLQDDFMDAVDRACHAATIATRPTAAAITLAVDDLHERAPGILDIHGYLCVATEMLRSTTGESLITSYEQFEALENLLQMSHMAYREYIRFRAHQFEERRLRQQQGDIIIANDDDDDESQLDDVNDDESQNISAQEQEQLPTTQADGNQ